MAICVGCIDFATIARQFSRQYVGHVGMAGVSAWLSALVCAVPCRQAPQGYTRMLVYTAVSCACSCSKWRCESMPVPVYMQLIVVVRYTRDYFVYQVYSVLTTAASERKEAAVILCCLPSVTHVGISCYASHNKHQPPTPGVAKRTVCNADHLATYGDVDISLDTFPYAGTTTTCESLYMGVPCVTLAGACHAHNVGVSLLTTVGINKNWVAKDRNEYVDKAVQAASNVLALSKLRQNLRQQMLDSPLCDAETFVSGLETCYCQLWQRHTRQQKNVSMSTPTNESK